MKKKSEWILCSKKIIALPIINDNFFIEKSDSLKINFFLSIYVNPDYS